MGLEDDPIMVSCLMPKYEGGEDGTRKAHQEIDWSMEVKIDGFEGFGDLPPEEFSKLIQSRVKDAAEQGLRFMRKNPETLPQYHLEESADLDTEMETERLTQFETKANPFIGIFHMSGRAVVEAKLPVSADEALLMVQRRLAEDIASRVAALAADESLQINKSAE